MHVFFMRAQCVAKCVCVCVYLDDVFDADVFQARAAAAADLVDDAVWSAAGHGELARR